MMAQEIINAFGYAATVRRFQQGSYVDGIYTIGQHEDIETVMAIQPMTGKELLNRPEAQRERGLFKGWASIELFTASQSAAKKADRITSGGDVYEVQKVLSWRSPTHSFSPYWEVELALVNSIEE